ncbi:FAD dependent oxidoreductase [Dendrothele bispora CBS 962.96]|uniref:FAD dependent oxidoreductase n=1 Tax=Dendrothele bispora (strain CBS 962.96) TaxID=1314807 RepID=A0A4S8LA95_DENBC|nr:FAD dependent oxidoreductase [Dendrothele bispora CBS 962.96]
MVSPQDKIVIIGAGCFGISTAYHLSKRGFTDITVIDRSETLPAKDGSSNDFNRIVRTSYSDNVYTVLAKEAIEIWKDRTVWEDDSYHECGVLVLASRVSDSFVDESYINDKNQGSRVDNLPDAEAIKKVFPPHVPVSSFNDNRGYMNHDGGWADAGKAVSYLTSKVKSMGVKVNGGHTVKCLRRRNNITTGVECEDGTVFEASKVVIATGSWTSSVFRDIGLKEKCLATGQVIAMIQLTKEEADRYRQTPVVLNFATGFYCFPPTDSHIVKLAIHAPGFTHTVDNVSTPRTIITNPEDGLAIPKKSVLALREHLRTVYPELAGKPFKSTRLCWYNDSPDGDWIIGPHPEDGSLIFATAGSGHAFKFFPVIGRLVADAIQDKLDPPLAKKFAVNRPASFAAKTDGVRAAEVVKELDISQLCTPEDLLLV